jgi:hypothetical protein
MSEHSVAEEMLLGENGHRFRLRMATDSGEWPLIPGIGHPHTFYSKAFLFTIINALEAIQYLRQWPNMYQVAILRNGWPLSAEYAPRFKLGKPLDTFYLECYVSYPSLTDRAAKIR